MIAIILDTCIIYSAGSTAFTSFRHKHTGYMPWNTTNSPETCALRCLDYGTTTSGLQFKPAKLPAAVDIGNGEFVQWSFVKKELLWLIRSAAPIAISSTAQPLIMIPMLSAVSRFGNTALMSMNLAKLYSNICGVAPTAGISMALDTYCSQGFTSARDKRILGVLLQRAMLMGLATMAIFCPLWWNSMCVFKVLGVPEDVAEMAGRLVHVCFFGNVLLMAYEFLCSFLFAQGIRRFVLVAQPAGVAVAWAAIWLLLSDQSTSAGVLGTAFVNVCTMVTRCTTTVIFIAVVDGYQCWGSWTPTALHGWKSMAKLSVAGFIARLLGMASMHIIDLGSVLLGTQAMAAQTVLTALLAIPSALGYALAIAACNRVGNHLGLALSNHVRLTALATAVLSALVFGMLALGFFLCRYALPHGFTDNSEVIDIVAVHTPWVAIAGAMQGVNITLNGILRGQGKQGIIARVRLFSFALVGIPAGLVAMWVFHWELAGLWFGHSASLATALSFQTYLLCTTDWDKEVAKCQSRVAAMASTVYTADRAIAGNECSRHLP
ncbi:hypothetical protein DL89DRAFT_253584 [Linderina pennispora]|uniref:MATE efflux family protein n=1 Tax=Linderina pennispora TaxID=61395 RepID=A0A1Y1WKL5_9FUNG|nr:uncharacterized protein DL89DRAFT_253584 [Linderina pennispora]ORX73634.1 hypothetical protein DL89DRAFT_253584 [Linderina pennispora]